MPHSKDLFFSCLHFLPLYRCSTMYFISPQWWIVKLSSASYCYKPWCNSLKYIVLYIYASVYVRQIPMQGIVRIKGMGLQFWQKLTNYLPKRSPQGYVCFPIPTLTLGAVQFCQYNRWKMVTIIYSHFLN